MQDNNEMNTSQVTALCTALPTIFGVIIYLTRATRRRGLWGAAAGGLAVHIAGVGIECDAQGFYAIRIPPVRSALR